jgi:head-tail adaptor
MTSLISKELRAQLSRHRLVKVKLPPATAGKPEYARMCSDCGSIWPCWASQALKALKAAEQEQREHEASFNIRWKADMRAIKRWQQAHGQPDMWPDHADLCVWLMEQLEQARGISPAPSRPIADR